MIDDKTEKPVIVYASDMALRKLEPHATDGWRQIFIRNRAVIEAAAKKKYDFGIAGRTINILSYEV